MTKENLKEKLIQGEITIIDSHNCTNLKEINEIRLLGDSCYRHAVYERNAIYKELDNAYCRDAIRAEDVDCSIECWVLQIGVVSWFGSSGTKILIKFCPFCGQKLE